jgi:hypothetical protein
MVTLAPKIGDHNCGGTTMSMEAMKVQVRLLDEHQQNARNAYTESGDPDAVVLIVDVEDSVGGILAKVWWGEAMCRRLRAEHRAKQEELLIIAPSEREYARRLLRQISDAEIKLRLPPPAGYFSVAVLSNGGVMFGMVPISPTTTLEPIVLINPVDTPLGFTDTALPTHFLPPDFSTPA